MLYIDMDTAREHLAGRVHRTTVQTASALGARFAIILSDRPRGLRGLLASYTPESAAVKARFAIPSVISHCSVTPLGSVPLCTAAVV
jgi:hypothetical protein